MLLPLPLTAGERAAAAAAAPVSWALYVPTSASIHGNAGAFFHTDLWAFNRSFDTPLSVMATYRCFPGMCVNRQSTFVLQPRESKLYSDVAVTLFGRAESAGAIELTYTSPTEDLAATTRTYTPSLPLPTNGTAIPALTLADARTRTLFLGLGSNGGNLTSGFRTNVGAFNPGSPATLVKYTLFNPDGTLIGSATHTVGASSVGQINDIFAAAGAGSLVTTNAVLVVTSEDPVFPFVTVVDNQSGDSVYASPSSDEPVGPTASLVANGGFDTGIESWRNEAPAYIALSWSQTDATGSPSSGSILVTNIRPTASSGGNGPSQCVAVTPGSFLNISGRVRIPSGQASTGRAAPQLYFYEGSGCAGAYAGSTGLRDATRFDTWERQSGTFTVPANARSANVSLWTSKPSAGGTFVAYFDDFSIVSSPR